MAEFNELTITDFTGMVLDKDPTSLGLSEVEALLNCKIKNGSIQPVEGHASVLGTPSVDPFYLTSLVESGAQAWYYAGAEKIYRTDGVTHTDVTRLVGGDYSMDNSFGWNGCTMNGVLFLTNGIDPIQVKEYGDTEFSDLAAFPASTTAKIVRSFQSRVAALNLTESGINHSSSILISDATDPGTAPISWDNTDPTTLANRVDLSETPGEIRAAEMMKDSLIVYKTDAVYRISFIGGQDVDRKELLFTEEGAAGDKAVQEFEGKHFVVGLNDIYIHDGFQKKSIVSGAIKDFIFSKVALNKLHNVVVIKDVANTEMIVGLSDQSGSALSDYDCTVGFVWNWLTGNTHFRYLPKIRHAYLGSSSIQTNPAWDDAGLGDLTWDSSGVPWDSNSFNSARRTIIFVSATQSAFYQLGLSANFEDSPDELVIMQRKGIRMDQDKLVVFINRIIPRVFFQNTSGRVEVKFGESMDGNSHVWGTTYPILGSSSLGLPVRTTTRFISYTLSSKMGQLWKFYGLTFLLKPAGVRVD